MRLGQTATRGGIEGAHARCLFVGGDGFGPLVPGGAREAEGDGGDGVVIVGGDERSRELDRAVEAAELDEGTRELAGDEGLGPARQGFFVLDRGGLVLAAGAEHSAQASVFARAHADLLEAHVLGADAALREPDRLARARLGVADLEVVAPPAVDGGPRPT